MTEGLVKQSIAELKDIVRCRCRDAYKVRGLHDPGCECDSADAVQVVADRIEQLAATNEQLSNCVAVLEADLRKMTLDYLAAQGQASENFQMYVDANEARIDAEAKLSKAGKALDEAWYMLTVPHLNYEPEPEEPGLRRIKTTLAELIKERTQ